MDLGSVETWVNNNKKVILGYAYKFIEYVPYSEEDFLSAANEAFILSSWGTTDSVSFFEQKFWTHFKDILREMVPNPMSEDWSRSVPTNLCSYGFTDIIVSHSTIEQSNQTNTISAAIYSVVKDFLNIKEQRLFCLLLGLGDEDPHTYSTAAKKLGCSRIYAMKLFNRCCIRITELVNQGKIKSSTFCEHLNISLFTPVVDQCDDQKYDHLSLPP